MGEKTTDQGGNDSPYEPPFDGCSECGCPGCDPDQAAALKAENEVLRTYLSDDLLLRLSVEHGWPHEPGNPLGRWCCDEHRESFAAGTLYPHHPDRDEATGPVAGLATANPIADDIIARPGDVR